MLRRIIMVLALVVGAVAFGQGASQAAPLGATAQAGIDSSLKAEKTQYYYRRSYRPRYRVVRYYRPAYYRPYRRYRYW